MNHAEMSDLQINIAVARKLGLTVQERSVFNIGRIHVVVKLFCGVEELVSVPDYCNNPSDAWPIIVENNIGVNAYCLEESSPEYEEFKDFWFAVGGADISIIYDDKNPLRAAMIVFLMMNEDK